MNKHGPARDCSAHVQILNAGSTAAECLTRTGTGSIILNQHYIGCYDTLVHLQQSPLQDKQQATTGRAAVKARERGSAVSVVSM